MQQNDQKNQAKLSDTPNNPQELGNSSTSQKQQSTPQSNKMGSKLDQLKALRAEREGTKPNDDISTTSPNGAGAATGGDDKPATGRTDERPTNDANDATGAGKQPEESKGDQETQDGEEFKPVKVTEFADALGLDASEMYDLPIEVGDGSATLRDVLKSYQDQDKIEARTREMQTFEYNVQSDITTAMQLADEIGHRWSPQMQQALHEKQARDHQMNVSVLHRMFPDMGTPEGAKAYVDRVVEFGRSFGISPERLSAPQNWQEVAVFRAAMDTKEENEVLKAEIDALRNAAASTKNAKARKTTPRIRRPGKAGSVNALASEKRNALAGDKAAKARYMQTFRSRSQRTK